MSSEQETLTDIQLVWVNDPKAKDDAIRVCDTAFEKTISYREDYTDLFNKINSFADFIVAFVGDTIAGYSAIYTNNTVDSIAYITLIGVKTEFQGIHIGSMLMEKCISLAKMKQMKYIKLEVLANNTKAISFYNHWGFTFEKKCSSDSIYMIKKLS